MAWVLLAFVALERAVELAISRRNTVRLRARGAVEHGAAHYPALVALHVGWWVGMAFEAGARPVSRDQTIGFLAAFFAAQLLRWSAMLALGGRWSTRVLVLPGLPPVRSGIYRFLRHPNYVAVIVELAVLPLALGAVITAQIATVVNAVLLVFVRIPTEERALAGGR